ncbi:MAG: type II secretion system F family protein [Candidatus Pacebacteria bacterium]|nr:type II secretion system F family protein [Candidatus Paceibacterota bacterium]
MLLLLEHVELYVSSGLGIDKALETVAQSMNKKHARQTMHIHSRILAGSTLASSFALSVGAPAMVIGLIEHGEQSGRLAQSLAMARTLMERQDDIRRKSLSALTYPLVIGVFASLLTVGLVRGVMPQITPMLKSLRVDLPLLTRAVIFISENAFEYGLIACGMIAAAIVLVSILYRSTRLFKKFVHICVVHTPLIGTTVHSYALSVFLRSCGTLIDSGISAVTAYDHASSAVSLTVLASRLSTRSMQISSGVSIGVAIRDIARIPPHVSPLLLAGEASGNLGSSMIRAADIIDRDIDHRLKRITALIEPTMMAGMGIVVGAIALSIMMPIYDISRVLQR